MGSSWRPLLFGIRSRQWRLVWKLIAATLEVAWLESTVTLRHYWRELKYFVAMGWLWAWYWLRRLVIEVQYRGLVVWDWLRRDR